MYENLTLTYRPINNGQARTLEVVFGAFFFMERQDFINGKTFCFGQKEKYQLVYRYEPSQDPNEFGIGSVQEKLSGIAGNPWRHHSTVLAIHENGFDFVVAILNFHAEPFCDFSELNPIK